MQRYSPVSIVDCWGMITGLELRPKGTLHSCVQVVSVDRYHPDASRLPDQMAVMTVEWWQSIVPSLRPRITAK